MQKKGKTYFFERPPVIKASAGVVGKKEGEELDFGGLFGVGPVMPVRRESAEKFIARGGRIPAPMQSLKN